MHSSGCPIFQDIHTLWLLVLFSDSDYFVASCLNIARFSGGDSILLLGMLVRIMWSESPECTWKKSVSPCPQPKLTGDLFGAAGMQSSLRVWMCILDYLIFLFKDPGERNQAGWSSPLSPVMHPPWRLIVWFCKMRLNQLCQSKANRFIVILLSCVRVNVFDHSSIVSFSVVSHPKANCVTQYVAHDIYNLFIC